MERLHERFGICCRLREESFDLNNHEQKNPDGSRHGRDCPAGIFHKRTVKPQEPKFGRQPQILQFERESRFGYWLSRKPVKRRPIAMFPKQTDGPHEATAEQDPAQPRNPGQAVAESMPFCMCCSRIHSRVSERERKTDCVAYQIAEIQGRGILFIFRLHRAGACRPGPDRHGPALYIFA